MFGEYRAISAFRAGAGGAPWSQTGSFGQIRRARAEGARPRAGPVPPSPPWRRSPAGLSPHGPGGRGAAVGPKLPPRRCPGERGGGGAAGAGPSPEGRTGGKKERGRPSLTGRRGRRRGGGRRHGGSSQQKRPGARHSRREPASLAAPSSSSFSLRPTPQRGCYGHSARFPRARRPSGRAAAGKWRAGREKAACARRGRRRRRGSHGASAGEGRARGRGGGARSPLGEGGLPGVSGGGVHPMELQYSCPWTAAAHEGQGSRERGGVGKLALPGGAFWHLFDSPGLVSSWHSPGRGVTSIYSISETICLTYLCSLCRITGLQSRFVRLTLSLHQDVHRAQGDGFLPAVI